MYRENKNEFMKVLEHIQDKLPGIYKIEPQKFDNGQMMLKFWENGFENAFYSPKMSDGTLKLFAYYLLLHERNPRQLPFRQTLHKKVKTWRCKLKIHRPAPYPKYLLYHMSPSSLPIICCCMREIQDNWYLSKSRRMDSIIII